MALGTHSFKRISTADTNLETISTVPTTLVLLIVYNGNKSNTVFLKLYDKASNPDLAVDIPTLVIPVPEGSGTPPVIPPLGEGIRFDNGLSMAITSNLADNDATACTAGDVVVSGFDHP
jgi:hypothetical protein